MHPAEAREDAHESRAQEGEVMDKDLLCNGCEYFAAPRPDRPFYGVAVMFCAKHGIDGENYSDFRACSGYKAKEYAMCKPQGFDFEGWWNDIVATGKLRTGSPICALKPLYEKMREWGFGGLSINFDQFSISVWRSTGDLHIQEDKVAKCFVFGSIDQMPRALHDIFLYMYDNRVNKVKEKCDKDGPCDERKQFEGDLDRMYVAWNRDKDRYCQFCGQRRSA